MPRRPYPVLVIRISPWLDSVMRVCADGSTCALRRGLHDTPILEAYAAGLHMHTADIHAHATVSTWRQGQFPCRVCLFPRARRLLPCARTPFSRARRPPPRARRPLPHARASGSRARRERELESTDAITAGITEDQAPARRAASRCSSRLGRRACERPRVRCIGELGGATQLTE